MTITRPFVIVYDDTNRARGFILARRKGGIRGIQRRWSLARLIRHTGRGGRCDSCERKGARRVNAPDMNSESFEASGIATSAFVGETVVTPPTG